MYEQRWIFFYKIKSLYLKTYNAFATIRYISVLYITYIVFFFYILQRCT